MKEEIGKLWVEELRGGDFDQGQCFLRKENPDPDITYDQLCCLGVLCELAVEAGVIPEPRHPLGNSKEFLYGAVGEPWYLPREVCEWAGMRSSTGKFADGDMNLTYLNDSRSKTFLEIADIIEQNMAEL